MTQTRIYFSPDGQYSAIISSSASHIWPMLNLETYPISLSRVVFRPYLIYLYIVSKRSEATLSHMTSRFLHWCGATRPPAVKSSSLVSFGRSGDGQLLHHQSYKHFCLHANGNRRCMSCPLPYFDRYCVYPRQAERFPPSFAFALTTLSRTTVGVCGCPMRSHLA